MIILFSLNEPSSQLMTSWKEDLHFVLSYLDVDVAIAMDHLILAATAEGLGTCWIGAFDPTQVKRILHLPAGIEPIILTPLGYPAASPEPKSRKSFEEVIRYI